MQQQSFKSISNTLVNILLFVLLLDLCSCHYHQLSFAAAEQANANATANATGTNPLALPLATATTIKHQTNDDNNNQTAFKLNCQPGEQRQFNYESSTKVWGSNNQQVRISASLRLSCMEAPSESSLKYMAEIVSVVPAFDQTDGGATKKSNNNDDKSKLMRESKSNNNNNNNPPKLSSFAATQRLWTAAERQHGRHMAQTAAVLGGAGDGDLRAEPLLEDVGEMATRMRRSVSGWFSKTWLNVRDFFSNLFTSSERSSVSREQAFKETGVDILGQCRASSSRPKGGTGLPFDESVFDDLGPEYYSVGASLDGSAYEFNPQVENEQHETGDGDGDEDEQQVSFFDDPKPSSARSRRAASGGQQRAKVKSLGGASENFDQLIKLPFVFVQSRGGKIIELLFSGEESDMSVKNFKRHLCDLFATNLESQHQQRQPQPQPQPQPQINTTTTNKPQQLALTNEISSIGKHQTKYLLDASSNSTQELKESMIKASSQLGDEQSTKQLVRVLAMVGQQSSSSSVDQDHNLPSSVSYGRDPMGEQQQQLGSVSVLRSINTTTNLQTSSKMLAPDIEQMRVQVKQIQQITDGRLTGTAGQLRMSLVRPASDDHDDRLRKRSIAPSDIGGSQQQQQQQQQQLDDIVDLMQVSTSFSLKLVPIVSLEGGDQLVPTTKLQLANNHNQDNDNDDDEQLLLLASSANKRSKRLATESKSGRRQAPNANSTDGGGNQKNNADGRRKRGGGGSNRALIKRAPGDSRELRRVLEEWRKTETRLQMSPTSLVAEMGHDSSGGGGGGGGGSGGAVQLQRLEILRDQIRLRLNEEFLRNRIRRSLGARQGARAAAATTSTLGSNRNNNKPPPQPKALSTGSDDLISATDASKETNYQASKQPAGGDFGLSLTQLVLATGITSKQKGSIYSTIEEVVDLEASLAGEPSAAEQPDSVSRLLRNTIRMDKLVDYCKSAIDFSDGGGGGSEHSRSKSATKQRQQLRKEQSKEDTSSRLEIKHPFGLGATNDAETTTSSTAAPLAANEQLRVAPTASRSASAAASSSRFEQCKQMLRLMVKLNNRQAVNLVLDLIDDCNQRLLVVAKTEELGYGPVGKRLRNLRVQLVELLAHFSRPTDQLIDKLMLRLYHPKLMMSTNSSTATTTSKLSQQQQQRRATTPQAVRPPPTNEPEFVYVSKSSSASGKKTQSSSILMEEDDFNNNEAAGLLLATLTTLATKRSISRSKRLEVIEKLVAPLKSSTSRQCSLVDGPDLDILEAMGNIEQAHDEIVGAITQLARKCKHSDQYLIACLHGLGAGQLQHSASQRFLIDTLRSPNSSCLLKSEIVLTLTSAQLTNDLKQQQQQQQQQPSANAAGNSLAVLWPSSGAPVNQVDTVLWQLIDPHTESGGLVKQQQLQLDRRCLGQLIEAYLMQKRYLPSSWSKRNLAPSSKDSIGVAGSRGRSRLNKRAILNQDNFWDEAICKRWSIPMPSSGSSATPLDWPLDLIGKNSSSSSAPPNAVDLVDELDDNSLLNAIMNHHQQQQQQTQQQRNGRRNNKLIERELDSVLSPNNNTNKNLQQQQTQQTQQAPLRRRHKCQASKSFGPRNAHATLTTEIVNDLIGPRDENKFLARFKLATNFLGHRIDVGRMYLWHMRRTTRAHANILGRSIWDSSLGCQNSKAPQQLLYMPLFDFNLWLVKVSVGLRLSAEMGFFSNCAANDNNNNNPDQQHDHSATHQTSRLIDLAAAAAAPSDELELYPSIALRASGEASAKFLVARAGMSLASQYGYRGNIRLGRQPEACMSVSSAHQPMNVTFSSWFQLWDGDCHYWGSRERAEPQAVKWRVPAISRPIVWFDNECLINTTATATASTASTTSNSNNNNSISNLTPSSGHDATATTRPQLAGKLTLGAPIQGANR